MKNISNILKILFASLIVTFAIACSDDDKDDNQGTVTGNPVTGISLSNIGNDGIILNDKGATTKVQVTATPSEATDIDKYYYEFTSSDTGIFTVDNEGNITATGYGQAVLNVIAKNNINISVKYPVTVVGTRVTSVTIDENYEEIEFTRDGNNPTFNLAPYVTVSPDNASVANVKYTTSDYNIATIDEDGLITAVGKGRATIRVEAKDGSGQYDECTVIVRQYEYNELDRSSWVMSSSPTISLTTDEFRSGGPEYLIDSNELNTAVGLLKPGAEGGPATGESAYFTIDMGQVKEFNYYTISGLWAGSVNSYVKINRLSIYGSTDGENYTDLQTNISVSTYSYDAVKLLDATHNYRYVKIEVKPYYTSITGSSYVLIKDFKFINRVLTE